MNSFFNSMSRQLKGILIMLTGSCLLVLRLILSNMVFNTILIALSIAIIFYGFFVAGFYQKLMRSIEKHKE